MIRKISVIVFAYVLLVIGAEIAGRIYLFFEGHPLTADLGTYTNDDLFGYKPNPLFSIGDIRFNAKGFRADHEYSEWPEPSVKRILVVGGSTTFGTGVSANETYPAYLEKELGNFGSYEVVNGGVSGWQILQIRHTIQERIDALHPDIVLVSSCWNTGLAPYKYYRNEDLFTYPLFEYSILFRLLDRRLRNIGKSLHYHPFLGTRQEVLQKQHAINDSLPVFEEYERHVAEIVETCVEGEALIAFLIPPGNLPDGMDEAEATSFFSGSIFEEKAPDYPAMALAVNRTRDFSAERIKRVQGRVGCMIIDARHLFHDLPAAERHRRFYDELHLTATGNQVLARFLAKELADATSFTRSDSADFSGT